MLKVIIKSLVCFLLLLIAIWFVSELYILLKPQQDYTAYYLISVKSLELILRFIYLLIIITYARALYVLFRNHKRCTAMMIVNGGILAVSAYPLAFLVLTRVPWFSVTFILSHLPTVVSLAGLITIVLAFVFKKWDKRIKVLEQKNKVNGVDN